MYYYHGSEANSTFVTDKRDFEAAKGKPLVVVRVNGIQHDWDEDEDPISREIWVFLN